MGRKERRMTGQIQLFEDDKVVLDCTCGGRSIWFDKHNRHTVYTDIRREHFEGDFGSNHSHHTIDIDPDILADFTDLPFPDNTFKLVVFDPPHIEGLSSKSWTLKRYGTLTKDWRVILREGFNECMRVLEPFGVLVFKWSETQIPASELWDAIGETPLFGHHSGKKMRTFWAVFMKDNRAE